MPNLCASAPPRSPPLSNGLHGVERHRRATKVEAAALRHDALCLRAHGLSVRRIGRLLGRGRTTVRHHLRRARELTCREARAAGRAALLAELLHCLDELRAEAWAGQDAHPEGSVLRLRWAQLVARLLLLRVRLLMAAGVLRGARARRLLRAHGVRDWSTASHDELLADLARLRAELSTGR